MRYIALVLAVLLSGCTSLTQPDNEIRITEYSGNGGVLFYGAGEIGGCRVVQTGEVNAEVLYQGERCTVSAGQPE